MAGKVGKKSSNGTGPKGSLADVVAECISLLGQAKAAWGDVSPALTTADRQTYPKPSKRYGTIVPKIVKLYSEQGVVLPKMSVDDTMAALQTLQTLEPLVTAAQLFLRRVQDATLVAGGTMWGNATAFYTVLRRVEGSDPQLAEALKPLARAFKESSSNTRGGNTKNAGSSAETQASGSNGSASSSVATKGASTTIA